MGNGLSDPANQHCVASCVYAYAFGQLLVLSFKQYQEEGDAFKPRYEILPLVGRLPGGIVSQCWYRRHQALNFGRWV